MFRYVLVCLINLVSTFSPVFSQTKDLNFRQYESNQRLSNTTVSWITQDDHGFLWIATEMGLFKFDGYTFTEYQPNSSIEGSLAHELLFSVYHDQQGDLWVGSFLGLQQYNSARDNFISYFPDSTAILAIKGNFIQRIVEDKAGNLWIATYNGLFRFNLTSKAFERFPVDPLHPNGLSDSKIRSLIIDRSKKNLWIGTENGLNKMNLKTKKISRYFHEPDNPFSLSGNIIRAIYEDRKGNIWIGTQSGLNKLDPISGRSIRYRNNPLDAFSISSDTVLAFVEDRLNNLWIGTWNGLNVLEQDKEKFIKYFNDPLDLGSISGNTVTALYVDNASEIWIGTNKGLNKAQLNRKKFNHYFYNSKNSKGTGNNTVIALYKDKDKDELYWLGTEVGLVKFNKRRGSFSYLSALKNQMIFSINKDKKGILWAGTGKGLFSFDPKNEVIKSYAHLIDHEIWDIHIDKEGVLWIGTVSGFYKYNPETNEFYTYLKQLKKDNSLSENSVGTIKEDKSGDLWLGTALGGLKKFNKKTGEFISYKHKPDQPGSISSNTVTIIYQDSKGLLWVGTLNGLNLLNKNEGSFTYFPDEYYDHKEVHGILEDDHRNLWLCFKDGISKFNIHSKTYSFYQPSDGIQVQYSVGDNLKNEKGEMFFSGKNGLTVFHPDSIKRNSFIPPVVITDFSVFNKPLTPDGSVLKEGISDTKEITLSYDQFIFSFEFAALNFSNPEKNEYAYKLEGFEEDWNYVGNRRFASYSNIPSGNNYVFKVKGSNDDGVWNPEPTAVNIYITPPYWETIWFRSLLVISFISLISTGHQLRVKQIKRQKRKLEKQVEERTAKIYRQKEQIKEQASEIDRFNQLLQQDNLKLEENVKDLSRARVMKKQVSFEEFKKIYPDEETCLKFLAQLKWGEGYQCIKCGNDTYAPGPAPYSRRCSKCSTIERATTGTIFSRMRFPVTKAFYMLFLFSQGDTLTVDELSNILDHPRQTCWAFRKKIMKVIHAKKDTKKSQDGWSHLVLLDD